MLNFIENLNLDNNERLIITFLSIPSVIYFYKLITTILHYKVESVVTYYKIKTFLGYLIFLPSFIFITLLWINNIANMTTYLGLLSAGIAIALKDIIINIASWFFIIGRKPFNVGDRVQVGDVAGDVIDQKMFHFTLMEIKNWVDGDQSTGRIIHVPNYKVFSDSIANYSRGFFYIWNEINVHLTLDSNWEKAKNLLQSIANNHSKHLSEEAENKVRNASRKYMIYYNNLTPTVYTNVKDHRIQLTIRYLCEPKNRRTTTDEIWEKILQTFKEEYDITLT